ncbi:MAG: hypothetical protein AVDCRST_MAG06-287, partial [uncultured Nocardioides sp.]
GTRPQRRPGRAPARGVAARDRGLRRRGRHGPELLRRRGRPHPDPTAGL